MSKEFDDGIVGVEEFTAMTTLMQSHIADKIRAALLSLFDRGEYPK